MNRRRTFIFFKYMARIDSEQLSSDTRSPIQIVLILKSEALNTVSQPRLINKNIYKPLPASSSFLLSYILALRTEAPSTCWTTVLSSLDLRAMITSANPKCSVQLPFAITMLFSWIKSPIWAASNGNWTHLRVLSLKTDSSFASSKVSTPLKWSKDSNNISINDLIAYLLHFSRESLGDTEPLIDARLPSESQVSIHDLIRMGSGYHGVQIGEIPVRSSNPIIRDARFAQADDAIMNKYSSAQTSSDAEVSTSVEVSSDASTNLKAY